MGLTVTYSWPCEDKVNEREIKSAAKLGIQHGICDGRKESASGSTQHYGDCHSKNRFGNEHSQRAYDDAYSRAYVSKKGAGRQASTFDFREMKQSTPCCK